MTSERIQRRIDQFLDQADAAMDRLDWAEARSRAQAVLDLDPDNKDAPAILEAADRAHARSGQTVTPPSAATSPPVSSQLQPASFANGRYVVKGFLGEGGKKKVYLAHDSLLDRDVAFALIKTEGLDDAGRERIQREAQAMGRLGNHPNIVTVYDIGEENGQPYLVLPILSGGDVEGVIEKAPEHKLPLDQALRIAIETCQGLELAHSKGIVHRDLKPGNVWLTEDGRAMIGDFGLAVAADRSRLTQAGMMVGTVSYMPPEQAMGGEVGPKSDLYSLGAMLYEMVCGRPPFVGDESVAIIGQHLNTPPIAPTWHRPDCPPALETMILRLLEKDPARRPASATEVREVLASVTTGPRPTTVVEPAPAGGNDPLYRRTFVGRENEVKQLQAAFDGAMSGSGGLVMVVGEPGIGKTALCEQLATYVALRGGKALVGHCYEEGSLSLPYLAFVEAMRSYVLAREPDGLRSDLGTGAADVARIVSEVRDRVQGVELRPAGDPEDDRWRLLQSVTSFLRNASTVQPLVIVLEDLHWADRGTLDLLLHVSRNLSGARLLIVGTYRDVEVDRSHPLSNAMGDLRRINNFARIPLRGLTAEEVQRMMAAVAQRDIPWPLAELLHRQTEGSPLFVQEMLRYLVEEGLIAEHDGSLRRVGDDTLAGRIPEGLRDVIGKRLTRLGPDANRLLATASVIGRDFRLDVLQRVAAMPEDDVIGALEEAKAAAVIEERSSVGAIVTYRFSHAFFSQTLYEEISAPRRIRIHQQVGRALEEVFVRRLDEHAPELAEHFSHSSDPADLARAVHYGELAAQKAMSVFDYGEAVRLLERAVDVQEVLNAEDKSKRCDLLIALAHALMPSGEAAQVRDTVALESFELAESLGDSERASQAAQLALVAINRVARRLTSGTEEFRQWAMRADKYALPGTDARIYADVALAEALRAGPTRDAGQGFDSLERSLEACRGFPTAEPFYYCAGAYLGYGFNPSRAENRRRIALELAGRKPDGVSPAALAGALNGAAVTLLASGDQAEAEVLFAQLRELAEKTRDANIKVLSLGNEIVRLMRGGELDQAIKAAENYATFASQAGAPTVALTEIVVSFWARIYLGQATEAVSRFEELGRVDGLRTVMYAPRFGLTLAHEGHVTEANRCVTSFLEASPNLHEERIDNLVCLLEVAVLTRDLALAQRLLVEMRFYSHLVDPAGPSFGRALGHAAALLDQPTEAKTLYLDALVASTRASFRPEVALIRLDLAELLLEHYPDQRDAAMQHLDFAITELRDMKMQPALERALRHRGLLKA